MNYFIFFIFLSKIFSYDIHNFPFSDDFNILSLPESQKRISEGYKNFIEDITNDMEKIFHLHSNIMDKINLCRKSINSIHQSNKLTFYQMFISSGGQFSSFGNFKSCKNINVSNNTTITHFTIVEEYNNDTLREKVVLGACIPYYCTNLVEYMQNLTFPNNMTNYRIRPYPEENHIKNSGNFFSYVWLIIFLAIILLILLLNIFIMIFTEIYNPYDIQELNFEQQRQINYKEYISEIDNLERKKKSNLSSIKKVFFHYFSFSNNIFLLYGIKNSIYNDKKLRFINGLFMLFTIKNIFSSISNIISVISKDTNSNTTLYFINDYLNMYSKIYLEIFTFFYSFIITFKYLNYIDKNNHLKGLKILFLFIRSFDKIIIFIFMNLIFFYSLEIYMHQFNPDCMLWFVYDKYNNHCSYYHYIPFYDFYLLVTNEDFYIQCLNSNRVFLQSFYIFIFTIIILNIFVKIYYKLTFLSLSFIIGFILKSIFSVIFINNWFIKRNLHDLATSQIVFDYLHSQFFYNFPNLILGILTGYIYYMDTNLVSKIEIVILCPTLSYIEKIRLFFAINPFKNFLFILSFFGLFMYIGLSFKILAFVTSGTIYFFLLSFNGILSSLFLSLFILSVKVKSRFIWKFNQILLNFIKKLLRSETLLLLYRCYFSTIICSNSMIYFIILNFASRNPIYYDFFNVFIILVIPVSFLIFGFGYIVTLFFEIPLRILLKNKFNIKKMI